MEAQNPIAFLHAGLEHCADGSPLASLQGRPGGATPGVALAGGRAGDRGGGLDRASPFLLDCGLAMAASSSSGPLLQLQLSLQSVTRSHAGPAVRAGPPWHWQLALLLPAPLQTLPFKTGLSPFPEGHCHKHLETRKYVSLTMVTKAKDT